MFKEVWKPSGETIAVGESRQIGITSAPDTNVAEGTYTFHLHLESSNYQTTDIDLNVSVTQSGVGNILFKVQDIYTGTLDANDQLIQGVADARVKLQNEEVLTEEYTLNIDSVGEAYFTGLPAGHYKCRITANNHWEYIGRIWIKSGVFANEEVFLDYNLVAVEWEVNEITIEDKYEIVLNATYEIDVPAAVVIAEPSSITLPSMKAGDVYNGEFTLTNYGLIRADNVTYTMPEDDQYFHYELLQDLPSGINAKDRIIRKERGWRWEDNHGRWREFEQKGNMTSFGSRSGIVGKLLYDNDRLTGYTDRIDNQVLWIEYDANDKISAVHDINNRRVEYGYTAEGLLNRVTDVLGSDTTYQYDGEGRIIKTINAAGREANGNWGRYRDFMSRKARIEAPCNGG